MDSDEDIPTKRESHFNQQRSSHRSSLRSEKSANQPQRSRSRASSGHHLIDDFNLDLDRRLRMDQGDVEPLPSPSSDASPAPNIPFSRSRGNSSARRKSGSRAQSAKRRSGPEEAKRLEEVLALPSPSFHLEALRDPGLREPRGGTSKTPPRGQSSHTSSWPLGRGNPSSSQVDITALPNISKGSKKAKRQSNGKSYSHARSHDSPQSSSRLATEIYTISYLIFFAIWGTLARVGLQALTFYPGAPVIFSELWANVAGTFIMGFLSEDRRLFRAEWGNRGDRLPEPYDHPAGSHEEQQREKARHGKVKKTIPMYIGLATGFCGSFTSFSSFIRDVFLALANELPSPVNHRYPTGVPLPSRADTMPRKAGYSVMALLATIILTIATCTAALQVGAHLALALDRITPSLPFRFTRRFIDPLFVFLGWGTWFGALMMAIFPPRNPWRGQAIFACVFAPLGCLARYYISLALNPIRPSFPLGTFTVNIFGSAVLGMAYDLQRVPLLAAGVVGGSVAGCQVLQGVMDGFCGCLTTVSTWIVEIDTLKRRSKYVYAGASVGVGVALMVVIMGSVRWTVGWEEVLCVS